MDYLSGLTFFSIFLDGNIPVGVVDVLGDKILHLLPKRSVVIGSNVFPHGIQNHFVAIAEDFFHLLFA